MKKIMLVLFLVTSVIASAVNSKVIKLKEDKVELIFENVGISKLMFSPGSELIVEDKSGQVRVTSDKNKVIFSSKEFVKIKLTLPDSKSYVYKTKDNSVCNFNRREVVIKTEDGETIVFKDGNLKISEADGESKVRIDSEGIFINNDSETVQITSRGIKIDSDEENKNITGFWGELLGNVISSLAKGVISLAGKSPEKIMKRIINDHDGKFTFNIKNGGKNFSEEFFQTVNCNAGGVVNVYNKNGSIKVIGWEKDFVDIYAEKTTDEDEEELEKAEILIQKSNDGKVCDIKTNFKEPNVKVSVKYIIKVPQNVKIGKIHTANGSLKIANLSGNAEITTSNGSIKVEKFDGNLVVRTSNGSIKLTEIEGKVKVSTSNGSIKVSQTDEIVSATTSNGSITAEISQLKNDVEFSTSNGSINLYLTDDLNAEIIASTSNAKIHINDVQLTTSNFSGSYLKGKIGNGGNLLKATTSNSSINIYKLEK